MTTTTDSTVSAGEVQTVVAARRLSGVRSVFIGVGRPSTAALLARLVHNPDLVLVYESGTIGAKPEHVPLSIGDGPGARERLGFRGRGPTAVITDKGVLEPDPDSKELVLVEIHPGVSVDDVRESTGWKLKIAPDVQVTPTPTEQELTALRTLTSR